MSKLGGNNPPPATGGVGHPVLMSKVGQDPSERNPPEVDGAKTRHVVRNLLSGFSFHFIPFETRPTVLCGHYRVIMIPTFREARSCCGFS